MKYLITEEQLNFIINKLGEVKAKHSFNALSILSSLPKYQDKPEDIKPAVE
jgi:hypothetical protein